MSFIPQMNPMNWIQILLFIYFCFIINMVKIYFLSKLDFFKTSSSTKSYLKFNLKI